MYILQTAHDKLNRKYGETKKHKSFVMYRCVYDSRQLVTHNLLSSLSSIFPIVNNTKFLTITQMYIRIRGLLMSSASKDMSGKYYDVVPN